MWHTTGHKKACEWKTNNETARKKESEAEQKKKTLGNRCMLSEKETEKPVHVETEHENLKKHSQELKIQNTRCKLSNAMVKNC